MYDMEDFLLFFECYKEVCLWAFMVVCLISIFFILSYKRQENKKREKNARRFF